MNKMNLIAKKCTPCQGGIPPMTQEAAEKYLQEAPEWELRDHATRLKRTFKFNNFADAMKLAQKIGDLCEEENHHPDITVSWGYCRVEFQTHKINGLHENDFIMAAKVNHLAGSTHKLHEKAAANKVAA